MYNVYCADEFVVNSSWAADKLHVHTQNHCEGSTVKGQLILKTDSLVVECVFEQFAKAMCCLGTNYSIVSVHVICFISEHVAVYQEGFSQWADRGHIHSAFSHASYFVHGASAGCHIYSQA